MNRIWGGVLNEHEIYWKESVNISENEWWKELWKKLREKL